MIALLILVLFWFLAGFFNPPLTTVHASSQVVALTFDDGPSVRNTERILDVLREEDTPATFFVMGEKAEEHPEIILRMAREGHEIENHSFSHPHLLFSTPSQVREEIEKTSSVIARLTGKRPSFFRPPYGQYHLGVLGASRRQGLVPVLWTITSYDWRKPGVPRIIGNVVENLKPGAIALFHDGENSAQTVEALPHIIREAKQKGFQFARLADLQALGLK